jgi:hypothetical protein
MPPFGTRAKQFTGDLAFGETVTVTIHDHDRYGRTVAEIILPDGRNLNQEIVRAVLAWWYEHYAKHDLVLRDLEREARAAKRGLWVDAQPVPPWEWRKTSGSVNNPLFSQPSPLSYANPGGQKGHRGTCALPEPHLGRLRASYTKVPAWAMKSNQRSKRSVLQGWGQSVGGCWQ